MPSAREPKDQTIAVIGLGYIGLPTAAILAMHGVQVIGVDVNPATVEAVNRGELPFVEPDLGTALAGAVKQGRLFATTETPSADVYIIAVPTPFAEDHEPDLTYIDAAADSIAPQLKGGELVILESTSPPGTTEHLSERVLSSRGDLSLDGSQNRPIVEFAHCPERVLPGRVMVELVTNDRVVGGLTQSAAERAKEVYELFCQAAIPLTDARTAEMVKLVENSFRDVNIAFANELAILSRRLKIDVWELISLANRHPRVQILNPGAGVGGHCIAVDPWFIVASAPSDANLIHAARRINDARPAQVISDIKEAAKKFSKPKVAILGLAFKPNIDDMRQSPAVQIAHEIASTNADWTVLAVEPHVNSLPDDLSTLSNIIFSDYEVALRDADIVAILVAHSQFDAGSLERVVASGRLVLDVCGLLQLRSTKELAS